MAAARRMPNLLLSLLVLLAVTGIALLCIAIVAKQLQEAVHKAQEAAERERQQQSETATRVGDVGQPAPEEDGGDAESATSGGNLPEDAIRQQAVRYKDEWLQQNPDDLLEGAVLSKLEKTTEGWHAVFEGQGAPAHTAAENAPKLHVNVGDDGTLIKVNRDPDKEG